MSAYDVKYQNKKQNTPAEKYKNKVFNPIVALEPFIYLKINELNSDLTGFFFLLLLLFD